VAPFLEALEPSCKVDGDCHSAMHETTVSPSYPGLPCTYLSHIVRWAVHDSGVQFFRAHGLPVDHSRSSGGDPSLLGSDFMTTKVTERGWRKIFWQWTPFAQAQREQRFVNLGEATADERWAKYAFQKEGVVQFPPTEAALAILLQRCGMNVAALRRSAGCRTLQDLWKELTTEESYLQMSAGQPLRVMDATVVRLRWRANLQDEPSVLVQVREKCWPSPSRQQLSQQTPQQALQQAVPQQPSHWRQQREQQQRELQHQAGQLFGQQPRQPPQPPQLPAPHPEGQQPQQRARELLQQSRRLQQPGRGAEYSKRLFSTRKRREETWEASAIRCLAEELHLSEQQVRGLLSNRVGEKPECVFYEERQESEEFPGLQCLCRTHLVSCALREDARASPHAPTLGLQPEEGSEQPAEYIVQREASSSMPLQESLSLEWLDVWELEGVRGADLWERVLQEQESHRVSSVLLGLEGTAPNMKSPFGVEHDASGKSAETSALGNHKWRAYRAQGALQIPSDTGGMRMRITRRMFEDLIAACTCMELGCPSLDLVSGRDCCHPRWVLDHRFAEREFFKRILASSGREARQVVAWMEKYRASRHSRP